MANDFTRAALRISFLASCVSACQSQTMSLADADTVIEQSNCFLEASHFWSTELVLILLQIAQRNSLDVDVDLALGFASHYGKIGTMECLVEDGNAVSYLGPLTRAAERYCMPVVEWFVERGCQDVELCLALTATTSSSQVEIVAYLLPHVPLHILAALNIEILKAAAEQSGGSLEGVVLLFRLNFLGDPAATYAVADSIATSDDEAVSPYLRAFLQEHWSEAAFLDGLRQGQVRYTNLVQIFKSGESPICFRDLPAPLRVAIAYLPLCQLRRLLVISMSLGSARGSC
ncbi:Ankyrin repeat family protein [Abeliophyllum distichum]|uniref:Ankyrin repeat family protein n=1 Tax=Abeliophyllum distichum TaxID=126358 RepID=A0ABD1RA76_9LAMI